jgi:Fe-S oxidoreductase
VVVALVIAVVSTVVGVWVFTLGVRAILATLRLGGPAPDRRRRPWLRTWRAFWEIVHHKRFRSRPAVLVAHWFVMVSFPVLFLTLATSYGQLVDPRFALPLVGHWAPLEWVTELLAWTSLLGIVVLAGVRQREHPRRGRAAARALAASGDGSSSGAPGSRASRFFGSNAGQAYFVEAVVGGVVLAVLVLRGLEYALAAQGTTTSQLATAWHFPLTAWFGASWVDVEATTLETAVVVTALVKILISMSWMVVVGTRPAMGVSWHRFLAVVNVWARREIDGGPALGPLTPVRSGGVPVDFEALDDLPDDARLGVGRITDLSWKGLLDLSTCTECGRCQEACPAWATGKVLSPKLVVLALRDHAHASTPGLRTAPNASTEPAGHTATTGRVALGRTAAEAHADVLTLAGDVVDPQALWDCTTCGACVQACPVDIEHVDLFVDLRRNQVLMESDFPTELGAMFTGLERHKNPWGLPPRRRMDWAKGLDFPVPVIGADVGDATEVDYLFWVGCAGSYDDNARRTTRAVAELLHIAGVSFAVLGDAEGCSGDPARRAGNELLFQEIARSTIETLTGAKAQRIVVTCAHCFNALGREYPELGGVFDVVHHTELLDQLVREGRLVPTARPADEVAPSITYHDPCYLGRHNQVYAPPRELIAATGATLTEMPRSGEQSFCCGGGGARAFMEETVGTRIATDRAAEAVATGAQRIATACPFCIVMLTGGVAAGPAVGAAVGAHGAEPGGARDGSDGGADVGADGGAGAGAGARPSGRPEVVDVAQVLLDAVRPLS